MPYLIAAVVVLGVLTLFNLLLLYGVIRRLREQTELPATRSDGIAKAGSMVGAFTATTIDGVDLTNGDLQPDTLVGFFTPSCSACTEELPKFVDVAAGHAQDRVLAVVVGSAADTVEQARELSPKARVVVAPLGSGIVRAFDVQGYPAFALIGAAGEVKVSGGLNAVTQAIR